MKALEIGNVKITSGFWKEYQELILKKVIPYQWDILNDKVKGIEKSHAIDNFRIAAGISNDKFYGEAYQDSDLYKWLEAVGNALQVENNIELEKKADEVIDLLEGAQEEDGYLNTYFQLVEPEEYQRGQGDRQNKACRGMRSADGTYIPCSVSIGASIS